MPGGQGSQNYTSPTLDRSINSTIMGGNLNINEPKSQVPPGAPPVNRLVDILNNKSGFNNSNMSNCGSNLMTPNDSIRNNNKLNCDNDYYGNNMNDKTDLSCKFYFY